MKIPDELKKYLVKIQHRIKRTGETIIKFEGKYYKIKELG